MYLTRFRTKQNLGDEGASDILPPSPFNTGQFLRKTDILVWCLYRYWSTGQVFYQGKGSSIYVNFSFVLNLVKLKNTDLDWK